MSKHSDLGNWPLKKITPSLIVEWEAMFAGGATRKEVARKSEIPLGIVKRWLEAGAESAFEWYEREGKGELPIEAQLHLRCEKGRGEFTHQLRQQLIDAGAGKDSSPGSAGWMLERLEQDEWGLSQKLEISGAAGGPIAIEGRTIVGIADVVSWYLESGQGHLLGLGDGGDQRALPAAREVLPDPSDDERAADGALDVQRP